MFLSCLADRLGLEVDIADYSSIRVSTPPAEKAEDINYTVPNVIQIASDGSAFPVDYELRDEGSDDDATSSAPPSLEEVL